MKACVFLVVGGLLIAAAVLPINMPHLQFAAYMEWAGAFMAFTGLSYLLGLQFPLLFGIMAFVAGSVGDSLLGGFNSIGWVLVNYMVFVHSFLGILVGYLLRRGHLTFGRKNSTLMVQRMKRKS